MSKPFKMPAGPGRNPMGQYSPAPAPNPMAVYNGADASGVDMQTHVKQQDIRQLGHVPQAPPPPVKPGASPPMRLR